MKKLTPARLLVTIGTVLVLSSSLAVHAMNPGTDPTIASNRAIVPVELNQPQYPTYPVNPVEPGYPTQPQLPAGGCEQYPQAPIYPNQAMQPSGNCGQYFPPQYLPQPNWVSPQAIYQSGLQLVKAKRYQSAIQVFAQFLQAYPNSDLADNALYWTGESYYGMKMYPAAISYFQQIQYRYPRGNKVPDSMLKGALAYFAMNQTQQGCMLLNELQRRYPSSESAGKAKRYSGRCQAGGGYYYPQNPCQTPYQPYGGNAYPSYPTQPSYPSQYGSSCY